MTTDTPLLRMTGIRKAFGDVIALNDVDFALTHREIHGLLGSNGAGKTTLMNILYGLYAPDSGGIEIDGRPLVIDSPGDAIAAGVGMVHQSFLQVDPFTVTQNVALGTPTGGARLDLAPARAQVRELSERFGLAVDPDAVVEDLPVGIRQRVEILKALYRGANILILDEPTTNLTPQEVDDLFSSIREMVDKGMTVILITHKIRETMAVCERMTVMREGRCVATTARARTSADELAAMMVGEPVAAASADREESQAGPLAAVMGAVRAEEVADDAAVDTETSAESVRVDVRKLSADGDLGERAIDEIDLQLARGEVVGVAGVAGNGQVELAEALSGVRPVRAGSVVVDGESLTGRPTAEWLQAGVTYVPEDRQRDGILPNASIVENLLLGAHRQTSRRGLVDWPAARRRAATAIEEYAVQTPGPGSKAGQLSGGNMQRVILARAFAHQPRLLVLHNPTRGLDIRSTQFVYERVRGAAERGCGVLIISEDLDELIALADRLVVISSGRLVGEHRRGQIDAYKVGREMLGMGGQS